MEIFSTLFEHQMLIYPSILRAIDEMGFKEMTPIQEQAIPLLLTGHDVIGQAQTGTGKTAAFGIPLLQKIDPYNKNLQAIVLCPTRELAVQAANEIRSFAKYMHDIKVLPVFGGQDISKQIRGLKHTQIVVGTPGRVMDHMRRHTIRMDEVSIVVLDEADEMLNMGFREDMEVILGAIEHPHQTCLFSATMPQPILDITHLYQTDPQLVKVTAKELTIDLISQYYYPVKWEYKLQAVQRLLQKYRYKRCIIFCNTKHMVDELAETLRKDGYAAEGLHGDLSQSQRDSAMGRFRGGSLSILIATDIAARGIDVDDVEAVINFDIPQETEYYVHRIGRTGRAGKYGISHTLCGGREFRQIREIERICHTKLEERRLPTPDEIAASRAQESLEQIMEILSEGGSGKNIPLIREYCEENNLSAEVIAAAYLTRDIGEKVEELEIDLPEKPVGKPRKERNERLGGFRRERRGHREDKHRERRGNYDESRQERMGRHGESRQERRGHREDEHQEYRDRRGEARQGRKSPRFGFVDSNIKDRKAKDNEKSLRRRKNEQVLAKPYTKNDKKQQKKLSGRIIRQALKDISK